jgi:hypothetical protein
MTHSLSDSQEQIGKIILMDRAEPSILNPDRFKFLSLLRRR